MTLSVATLASLLELAIVLGAIAAVALLRRRHVAPRWLVLAAGVIVLHELALTRAFWLLPQPGFFAGLEWNWFNKLLATAASCLMIALLPDLGFRDTGVTLRHRAGSVRPTLTVTLVVCGLLTLVARAVGGEPFDLESLLFQASMPGIEEELFYRGLLLVCLDRAFGRPRHVMGAAMGWGGLLAAFAFGAGHLISWTREGAMTFQAASAGYTFVAGLGLVWLRERSGSLLQPLLVHNFGNTIFYLI